MKYKPKLINATDEELFEFAKGKSFLELFPIIDEIENEDKRHTYRKMVLENLIDQSLNGFVENGNVPDILMKMDLVTEQIEIVKEGELGLYTQLLICYLEKKFNTCNDILDEIKKNFIESRDKLKPITEEVFYELFVERLKAGYERYYDKVKEVLMEAKHDEIVLNLCDLLKGYYELFNDFNKKDQRINLLSSFLRKYPESIIAKDMLFVEYYENNYGAAVSFLEKNDNSLFFNEETVLKQKAICYFRIKEYDNAINSCEKLLESYPETELITKNLIGWLYYKKKDYKKALSIFEYCIENKIEFPYSANNYTRTLLMLEKYDEALEFVNNPPCRLSKDIIERVIKVSNKSNQVDIETELIEEELFEEIEEDKNIHNKNQECSDQFSNEKILEDELTSRIDKGDLVFGKKLKIYRRKGEYGRQYIIPIGRLDLLCEDDDNNLYIIELKKDSGYSDPYQQTRAYIEWFNNNKPEGIKNVYGIICLNSPSKKLINQCNKDNAIELYEYSINYSRIN